MRVFLNILRYIIDASFGSLTGNRHFPHRLSERWEETCPLLLDVCRIVWDSTGNDIFSFSITQLGWFKFGALLIKTTQLQSFCLSLSLSFTTTSIDENGYCRVKCVTGVFYTRSYVPLDRAGEDKRKASIPLVLTRRLLSPDDGFVLAYPWLFNIRLFYSSSLHAASPTTIKRSQFSSVSTNLSHRLYAGRR